MLKNSVLRLILGGAALQRRGRRAILSSALAAEVRSSNRKLVLLPIVRASLTTTLLALVFSASAFAEIGAETYKARCSACHGANGSGETMLGKNLKVRPLGSDDVQNKSDDEIAAIISKGKKRMPPFGGKLSKDQIRDVVKYIRLLKK